MKILLASSGSGSRGGGEIFLDYLGRGLSERHHEVLTWIPDHPRMDELAERCASFSRVIRSHYKNTYDYPGRSFSAFLKRAIPRNVAREWQELAPDVIHVNKQNLEDGLDLLRAARLAQLPTVCTIHLTQSAQYLQAKAARLRDWVARTALRQYPGDFVAVQEARRADLAAFAGEGVRTQTVYNGVPLVDESTLSELRSSKRRDLGVSDDQILIAGVGRLVPQKRPFVFLDKARELHALLPETRFLWVGDGALAPQWLQAIKDMGLRGVVSCAGWQSDTLPFFAAADLLLHVAEFEGLPLAIVEAMAANLPCAVTSNFASEIDLFDERTVLFADDVSQLAGRIRDGKIRRQVAIEARKLVAERLSRDAMVSAYERLYTQAVKR